MKWKTAIAIQLLGLALLTALLVTVVFFRPRPGKLEILESQMHRQGFSNVTMVVFAQTNGVQMMAFIRSNEVLWIGPVNLEFNLPSEVTNGLQHVRTTTR